MLFAEQSAYYHAKGSCYLCGRSDSLVDTGVQIEGEGVLAICSGCVKGDMLRTLGIDLDSLEMLAGYMDAAVTDYNTERQRNRELRAQIKALRAELAAARADD